MKCGATASPRQVDDMMLVVSRYCRHAGIKAGSKEEKAIALQVVGLFEIGLRDPSKMLRALIAPPVHTRH